MVILKSIGFGLLSLIAGNLIALILALIVGLVVEPIAKKGLSEPSLKKFRHIWSYAWVGFTVGLLNSSLIFFFEMNGITLLLMFLIYLVFFMRHKNEFVLNELCNGEISHFKKLSRTTEIITFISYIVALCGLWTILIKCGS